MQQCLRCQMDQQLVKHLQHFTNCICYICVVCAQATVMYKWLHNTQQEGTAIQMEVGRVAYTIIQSYDSP